MHYAIYLYYSYNRYFFVYVCDLFTFDMYIICIILYYLLNVLLFAFKHLFKETTLNYSDGL